MNNLIGRSDERIKALNSVIERIRYCVSFLRNNLKKAPLNNEFFITDKELQERLKVSRRTLQEWRNSGRIAYTFIGGKVLYRESDIQEMLKKHYRNANK